MKSLFVSLVITMLLSLSQSVYCSGTNSPADIYFFKKKKVKDRECTDQPSNATNQKNSHLICSVTCRRTIGYVTFETSAGGLFTSCSSASARCEAKLDEVVNELTPESQD